MSEDSEVNSLSRLVVEISDAVRTVVRMYQGPLLSILPPCELLTLSPQDGVCQCGQWAVLSSAGASQVQAGQSGVGSWSCSLNVVIIR